MLVTLSEDGMLLHVKGQKPVHAPAYPVKVRDVSGAGDTVVGAHQLSNVRWSAVFDDVELTAADFDAISSTTPQAQPHSKSWVSSRMLSSTWMPRLRLSMIVARSASLPSPNMKSGPLPPWSSSAPSDC